MGYDVCAYKKIDEVEALFNRPKFEHRLTSNEAESNELFSIEEFKGSEYNYYFLIWVGSAEEDYYTEESLKFWTKHSQKLLDILTTSTINSNLKTWLVSRLQEGYSIAYSYDEFLAYRELESYKRMIFSVDNKTYIDCGKFCNGEIPNVFSQILDKMKVNLYAFFINDTIFIYEDTEEARLQINHSTVKAINLVDSIWQDIDNNFDKQQAKWIKEVLTFCKTIWDKGGKFVGNN